MRKFQRRQLFVDSNVQGALLARTMMYWAYCLLTVTLMLFIWRIYTVPAQSFQQHFGWMWLRFWPAAIASVMVLPIVAFDLMRLSNRFAGPMLRLRRSLARLADGEAVEPIHFREGDFWTGFADDFNRVAARLQNGTALAEVGDADWEAQIEEELLADAPPADECELTSPYDLTEALVSPYDLADDDVDTELEREAEPSLADAAK